MSISIKQVTGRPGIREFVRFPFRLYQDSKYWVPPLISREVDVLNPAVNPAQLHAPTALFMAFKGKEPVGRIAAIANSINGTLEGRFGWFDVIDDVEVSKVLFETAGTWLREKGATAIRGPMGFTNLDKAGMLTFGFDELPTIASIYNYPYYNDHLTALGFEKSADYVEYEFTVPKQIPEKVAAFSDIISKRYGVRILDKMKRPEMMTYGAQLFDLINETHRNLYGFILLPEEVRNFYVRRYMTLINPDFMAFVVNQENQLVAYGVSMPSMSVAFQKAGGTIFPFGFRHVYRATKKVERADLMLIGVTDTLRNKGVPSLIFHRMINTFIRYGVRHVESNPELEDNHQVHALWSHYDSRQHKRRRIYQKPL